MVENHVEDLLQPLTVKALHARTGGVQWGKGMRR
jgi:hypothetical protein